jgi:hypothetical protein
LAPSFIVYLVIFVCTQQIDALCQILDPDRNGFVDFPQLLSSFHRVHPLNETIKDKSLSERIALLVLTTATDELCRRDGDLNSIFSDIILSKKDSTASFANLLKSTVNSSTTQKSVASATVSGGSSGDPDVRRVQDVDVLADILCDLCSAHYLNRDSRPPRSFDLSEWPIAVSADVRFGKRLRQTPLQMLEYLSSHLRDVCISVARSLQVYSYAGDAPRSRSVLTIAATMFTSFLCFRRNVLSEAGAAGGFLRSCVSSEESPSARHPSSSLGEHPSRLLAPQQCCLMAEEVDGGIRKLLGEDRGHAAIEKSKVVVPEDFELSTSHLLGIVIPVGRGSSSCFALSALQLDVEYYLADFVPKGSRLSRYEAEDAGVFMQKKAIQQRLDTKSALRMADTAGLEFSLRRSAIENSDSQTDDETLVQYLESLNKEVEQIKALLLRLLKFRKAAVLLASSASNLSDREVESRKQDISSILSRVGEIFKDVDRGLLAFEVRFDYPSSCFV